MLSHFMSSISINYCVACLLKSTDLQVVSRRMLFLQACRHNTPFGDMCFIFYILSGRMRRVGE